MTNGANWTNNQNWLIGQPCENSWFGISCQPPGCHGDETIDNGPCVITDLDLGSNGLRQSLDQQGLPGAPENPHNLSPLPARITEAKSLALQLNRRLPSCILFAVDTSFADFDWMALNGLERVDLSGNGLKGPIPRSLIDLAGAGNSRLTKLEITDNFFEYDPLRDRAAQLSRVCTVKSITCSGVPPESCQALGDAKEFRPSFEAADLCVHCSGNAQLGFYFAVGGGILVVLVSISYVVVLVKFPVAFARWGGTLTLAFSHVQTLSIIGSLSVAWPPSAQVAFSGLDLFVGDMASLQAECLISGDGKMYYYKAMATLGGLLFCPVMFILLRVAFLVKRRHKQGDMVFFVGTIFFKLTLITSTHTAIKTVLGHCVGAVAYVFTGVGEYLDVLLLAMASVLVANYILTGIEQYGNVQHLRKMRKAKKGDDDAQFAQQEASVAALGVGKNSTTHRWYNLSKPPNSTRRLELRLKFILKSFGDHCPRWQFIVSGRQLILTFITSAGKVMVEMEYDQPTTNLIVWIQAGVAMLVIIISWILNSRYKPYAHSYQNYLENFLLSCSTMIIFFGMLYTILATLVDVVLFPIEVALVAAIIMSVVVGAVYAIRAIRHEEVLKAQGPQMLIKEAARATMLAATATIRMSRGVGLSNAGAENSRFPMLAGALKRGLHKEDTAVAVVKVVQATGLVAMDLSGICDPYVRLLDWEDKEVCTQTKQNTRNPVWNETLKLNLVETAEQLPIQVVDHDPTDSTWVMGEGKIQLSECPITGPKQFRIELTGGKGTIDVEVAWNQIKKRRQTSICEKSSVASVSGLIDAARKSAKKSVTFGGTQKAPMCSSGGAFDDFRPETIPEESSATESEGSARPKNAGGKADLSASQALRTSVGEISCETLSHDALTKQRKESLQAGDTAEDLVGHKERPASGRMTDAARRRQKQNAALLSTASDAGASCADGAPSQTAHERLQQARERARARHQTHEERGKDETGRIGKVAQWALTRMRIREKVARDTLGSECSVLGSTSIATVAMALPKSGPASPAKDVHGREQSGPKESGHRQDVEKHDEETGEVRRALTKMEKMELRRSSLMRGDSVDDMTSQKERPSRQTFRGRASDRKSPGTAPAASGATASSQQLDPDDSLSEITAQRI